MSQLQEQTGSGAVVGQPSGHLPVEQHRWMSDPERCTYHTLAELLSVNSLQVELSWSCMNCSGRHNNTSLHAILLLPVMWRLVQPNYTPVNCWAVWASLVALSIIKEYDWLFMSWGVLVLCFPWVLIQCIQVKLSNALSNNFLNAIDDVSITDIAIVLLAWPSANYNNVKIPKTQKYVVWTAEQSDALESHIVWPCFTCREKVKK